SGRRYRIGYGASPPERWPAAYGRGVWPPRQRPPRPRRPGPGEEFVNPDAHPLPSVSRLFRLAALRQHRALHLELPNMVTAQRRIFDYLRIHIAKQLRAAQARG